MSNTDYTQMTKEEQHPTWILWLMRSWSSILDLIHHIVTEAADKFVDIAARAIGISAPLPNAVSVFAITQTALGFTKLQAFALAFTLEVVVFAIIEIGLMIWDGYLNNRDRYAAPLTAIGIVAGIAVTVVIVLIYYVEVKHGGTPVLAALPLISVCAFVAIGLKRWHERNENPVAPKRKKAKRKTGKTVETSRNNVEVMNAAKAEKIQKRRLEISHIVIENFPVTVSEISKLLSVDVSDRTITNDLESLADDGVVEKDGRRWVAKRQQPTAVEFSTNGVAHHD